MAAHTLSVLPILPSASHSGSVKSNYSSMCSAIGPNMYTLISSFPGHKLSVRCSDSRSSSTTQHPVDTIYFPPPNEESEKLGKRPMRSARTIKALVMGELEAMKLRYKDLGTECLLLGILVEGTNFAAKFLRENGITYYKVQEEILNLLGKSSVYFLVPYTLPMTGPAKKALEWAYHEKLKSGESGELNTNHLLLGIWNVKESAGHRILSTLGFNDEKAEELSKSIDIEFVMSHHK